MPLEEITEELVDTIQTSGQIAHHGSRTIFKDPQIMLYPLLAAIFIFVTLPSVNGLAFSVWDKLFPHTFYSVGDHIPHKLRIIFGLVTFTYFYTTVVTTYFICAVSASVMHKLDDQPTTLLHGLGEVARHFGRVTHFALLTIFFMPLAVAIQWRRLPRGAIAVFGSALSLHTAQMAPAILNSKKSVSHTVLDSIDTLGKLWKEGLFIKICTWAFALLLTYVSYMAKTADYSRFGTNAAHWISWLAATLVAVSFWVLTKVLSGVYVSALYHRALNKKNT